MPVITIIWTVDDNLWFGGDYISYTMLPEKAKTFFEQTDIWKNMDVNQRV